MDRYPQPPTNGVLSVRSLGAVLISYRDRAGLSQRDLIDRVGGEDAVVGLSTSALSHWERDRRVPTPYHLLILVQALQLEGSDFADLLEAAAAADPLYSQSALLVRDGMWARDRWEEWAKSFPPRAARKTR